MAIKREDAQNAADRAAQQAINEGLHGGQEAADATRRVNETAADQSKRSAESAMDATRNVAQFGREQAQRTAAAAEQGVKQAADVIGAAGKSYGEIAEHSRGNVEAAMQSSARIARGLQEMGWEVARFSQDSLRSGLRVASEMMHCRSIEDMVEVQSHFVQESLDRVLDQQTRILRLSRTTADEAEQAIVSHKREGGAEARPQ